MIAARSCGLPAIAIPGTSAWQPTWARQLADKRITIVMDCDTPGRHAAHQIATSLKPYARSVQIIDLWPERHDGYDLTDRILERRQQRTAPTVPRPLADLLHAVPARKPRPRRPSPAAQETSS